MLIHEVISKTHVTKKAIEYYIEQGLLAPAALDNGYRDFTPEQAERLQKIAVLRKLGLSTENIREVLNDTDNEALQKLSFQKELTLQKETRRQALLEALSTGTAYAQVAMELQTLEQGETIALRLLDSFPGYYGKFICLHFSSFFNIPITTDEQKQAYEEILAFLDNIPALEFPKEIQDYLDENTKRITVGQLQTMLKNIKHNMENPEEFLAKNKELLEQYNQYLQSEEFKQSAAFRFKQLLLEFNQTSGYYDIFIPAMKRLSPAYAEYYRQIELADEKLAAQYPDLREG